MRYCADVINLMDMSAFVTDSMLTQIKSKTELITGTFEIWHQVFDDIMLEVDQINWFEISKI
jgi:hypothetical protein